MLTDSYRHKGLRRNLVMEIAGMGITDTRVLDAMMAVPRHHFLSSAFLEYAYDNKALQIGEGQTISRPYTVAFQSQLLRVSPRMKVLEIGTGSGYQTSILCQMGCKVYSVERQEGLHKNAYRLLNQIGYKAHLTYGDGFKGMPAFAPYDRILVTCGMPRIPEELLLQLKPGGRMVLPYGEGEVQEMMVISEDDNGQFTSQVFGEFSFVPMLEKRNSASR